MNRMNLSHSWEERMMYLASMHFGFPFTNFAFTSTCLKLFIVSELNHLLEKSVSERENKERRWKHREIRWTHTMMMSQNGEAMTSDVLRYETHRAIRWYKRQQQLTVVISPSSSDKYIPVMSPVALSNTSGFSNVKNAVPDVPSLDFVSFTSGTDVSTESRTKEIVAPFETTNFLLLLKLLLTKDDDCFACFRKVARVVVEDRRPTREDKVDIFFSYIRAKKVWRKD